MPELQFSIVIACHDQEAYIRQAVESALFYGPPSKEIIVVDDGSRDCTAQVLSTFGQSIILATHPTARGAGAARNHGASLARGEYLAFLDGDDVLMPWALDVYRRLITERSPEIVLGRSALCYGKAPPPRPDFNPRGVQFVEYPSFLSKDRPWVYNTSSFVVDRATFMSSGGWSEDIFYQDIQDLLNKLGAVGKTILVLAPDTVWYRMHSANAVRRVAPFLEGIRVLLAKAKAGVYPGGRRAWIKRSAWFGGLLFYWIKEALRSGRYRDALILLTSRWWMILLAAIRRGMAWTAGRQPVETLLFELELADDAIDVDAVTPPQLNSKHIRTRDIPVITG